VKVTKTEKKTYTTQATYSTKLYQKSAVICFVS